jgi:hypothetical protein
MSRIAHSLLGDSRISSKMAAVVPILFFSDEIGFGRYLARSFVRCWRSCACPEIGPPGCIRERRAFRRRVARSCFSRRSRSSRSVSSMRFVISLVAKFSAISNHSSSPIFSLFFMARTSIPYATRGCEERLDGLWKTTVDNVQRFYVSRGDDRSSLPVEGVAQADLTGHNSQWSDSSAVLKAPPAGGLLHSGDKKGVSRSRPPRDGADGSRTRDLWSDSPALSQLSYSPCRVGLRSEDQAFTLSPSVSGLLPSDDHARLSLALPYVFTRDNYLSR